jgi:ribosomal protein S18 acetylase RimI-like enzyme
MERLMNRCGLNITIAVETFKQRMTCAMNENHLSFPMLAIRKVQPDEAEVLSLLAIQTFSDTFAHLNTKENMQIFLTSAFSVEQLQRELSSPHSEFYFAIVNDELAGYIQLNFNTTEKGLEDFPVVEIGRLYVLQQFIGQKLGKALMEKAIAIAEERRADYLWLGVWEHNYRAIEFYTKWGFEFFGAHIFQLGDDPQIDLLVRKRITV